MTSETLQNRCFDEIQIGDTASVSRTLSLRDVQLFAAVSGDISPTSLDNELDRQLGPSDLGAHSMWLGAQVSGLLGKQLPGPGTVHSGQDLEFLGPLPIGEQVTITITATAKDAASRRVTFDCRGVNARGETIMTGTARVIAPRVRITMATSGRGAGVDPESRSLREPRRTLSATAAGIGGGRASLRRVVA
jgi:phosphate acetyltransferase